MGFTHLELMPVNEHPLDDSWGYQPIGLFAPTSRFGEPAAFARFVDRCHRAGLGVILDWVPAHFPVDPHGLARFDGTALYEHADPRRASIPTGARRSSTSAGTEVANYLIASALFWLDRYHVDGLRVDAVASMLYLDYSRKEGEWLPNRHGGNENLEAVAFLRRLNETVYAQHPGAITIAEESTAWPAVSQPTFAGGLGFGFKWNMGWMHDTLEYLREEPVHRRWHHDRDDVRADLRVRGEFRAAAVARRSRARQGLAARAGFPATPGSSSPRCAPTTRLMWAHPGKKLLFMGQEFAQGREWNFDAGLDWPSLAHRLASRRAGARARLQSRLPRGTRAARARLRGRGLPLARRRRRATTPSSRGCASQPTARGRWPSSRTSRRCRAPRYRIGLPRRAAGAKSSTPTAPPTADRIAATRAASMRVAGRMGTACPVSRTLMLPPLGTLWLVHEGGA